MRKLMFAMAVATTLNGWGSFSYQGALKMADGSAVTELSPIVQFRLYDGSGDDSEVLWAGSRRVTLSPTNGLFNVEISDSMPAVDGQDVQSRTPLDDVIAANADLYIGLTVENSSGEIRPRQHVLAVPTASLAHNVKVARGDFAVTGQATVGGDLAVSGRTELTGDTTVNGKVTFQGGATFAGAVSCSGSLTYGAGEVVPVPVGGIIMWTGSDSPDKAGWANDHPNDTLCHWAICNRAVKIGSVNVPDLSGRFVVGAGGGYSVGDKGGADAVKLAADEMPPHNHALKFCGADLEASWDNDNYFFDRSEHYKDRQQNRNTIHTESSGGVEQSDGSRVNKAHENRPPYYAVYYIMRVR